MAIIDTLNKGSFIDGMRRIRPDNFSDEGLEALYDYLEELSESIGEPIEFDPIAFCCEYCEYDSLEDLQQDYTDIMDMEDLESHTTVIMIDGDDNGFIIGAH